MPINSVLTTIKTLSLQPLLRSLQQTFTTTTVYHMHPLHLTSKWFHCTIMQHQGLGVHRVIKRFSNYYWSHAKGSMQILGRRGHGGFLCFQKTKHFFRWSHTHIYTEKKGKNWELPHPISDFPERCTSHRLEAVLVPTKFYPAKPDS